MSVAISGKRRRGLEVTSKPAREGFLTARKPREADKGWELGEANYRPRKGLRI